MIDVGLVGFGMAGRVFHAPFIRNVPGLNLKAIMRRSGEADSKYPGVQFVRTLDELLAIDSIRLVVVATPNDLHVPMARECLLAGRDVVVDKPFAPTLQEAVELVDLARREGRLITVFQNRRWDGDFKTVQQVIASGKLGRLAIYESHFDRYRPSLRTSWKDEPIPGTGLVHDLGPHLIDHALLLFGPPASLSADLRKERDGSRVNDAFDLMFYYPRMRAQLRASTMTAAPGPRFWICGASGTFTKYGLDPQESAMVEGGDPNDRGWGEESEKNWGTLTTATESNKVPTIPGNYSAYYENLRDTMLGKTQIAVTTEQALDVMKVIEMAIESSRKGCRVGWTK